MPGEDSPWFRVATDYWRNYKVAEVGFLAGSLHLAAIAYSAEQLTDGFIPMGVLPILAAPMHGWVWVGEDGKKVVPRDVYESRWDHLAERLCEVDLWDLAKGGFQIKNYTQYQPPRDYVLAKKERDQERAKKAAAARWSKKDDA